MASCSNWTHTLCYRTRSYRSSAWMNCSDAISYILNGLILLRRLKGWGLWSSKDLVVACLSDSTVSICYILYLDWPACNTSKLVHLLIKTNSHHTFRKHKTWVLGLLFIATNSAAVPLASTDFWRVSHVHLHMTLYKACMYASWKIERENFTQSKQIIKYMRTSPLCYRIFEHTLLILTGWQLPNII